jgi:hypothetical protein
MSHLLKVEGHNNLARDPKSGAIININRSEMTKVKAAREARRQEKIEIQGLKNEVSEIKDLLKQLLEKR